ncbi:MAG: flagellin [Selenomonadaceae bacterium]|nr:flagellin [Selenomonadaceae bacterium]
MSTVINTNIAAIRTHNTYNRNNDYMNAAMTKVATGLKINTAKDNASTWAISERMRERIRANDQANQNVQNDTALLKTAQGGVSNTIDILKTLKERAINAANDSNMNTDRDRIATEVEQLLEQINDNAAKVKFNGRTLLDGTGATDKTGGAFKTNEVAAAEEITDDISSQRAISTIARNGTIYNGTASDGTVAGTAVPLKNYTTDANATTNSFNVDGNGAMIKSTDTLVISWTDSNGETQKSNAITVGNLKFDDLKDQDWGDGITVKALAYDSTAGADNHILDENGNRITDADGNDLELASDGSKDGLYVIGSDGVAKDIKLTVYASDGTENTNGTALLKTTAVQTAASSGSSSAGTADIQGDHAIFGFKGLTGASGAALDATASIGTQLKDLELDGESLFGATPDKIKFTYGSGDSDYVELNGTDHLADLVTALDAKGIHTQILGADDQYRDVEDNQVLKTGYTVAETRAEEAGLYFVSGAASDDYDPSTFTGITITATDGNGDDVEVSGGVASAIMEYEDPNATEETETPSTSLTFYIGGEQNFGITANLSSMKVEDLFSGYDSNSFANLFTDQKTAETALEKINSALDTALNEQTKLGALEARLGYTSDNLTTMNENLEAADSVMRDSDIAKEMTNYMKYSVLAQASQYMLAQSSQNAFSVLNLLQA